MKRIIQNILKFFAQKILTKYHPLIIGITGSVGKTSTKEAIYTVLAKKFQARQNIKNYNNEIGLPLTVIGADSPGRSIVGWLAVFKKATKLILIKDEAYPRILVLEMGVDRPGDMQYLISFIKCNIGVVTTIGPVHLEFFRTLEKIQREKGELIKSLPQAGWAVLNYDNNKTREMSNWSKARVITFGLEDKADIKAKEVSFSFAEKNLRGVSFKLNYKGSYTPMLLPNVVGQAAVYSALAATAVGIAMGMNMVEISAALREFVSPPGRMNIVPGVKNTLIIDDTYNSSPQSSLLALGVLKMMPTPAGARKIAVLSDMLELGSYSEKGHSEIGKYAVKSGINKLVVVGERSRDIARGAKEAGMAADNIFHFADTLSAGNFLQEIMKENDLILIKGSQRMRMEKIVKEIMAEPLRASELLVRQSKEWLKR